MVNNISFYLVLYIKGMCMGTADLIPGVSGGTLALMLNIYDRLISSIKNISIKTMLPLFQNLMLWKAEHRRGFIKALNDLNAFFLLTIAAGIFTAVLALSTFIPHMIRDHTEFTFACFLGLIIPSIAIPWKMIKEKKASQYMALLFGLALCTAVSFFIKSNGAVLNTHTSFGSACIVLFFCAVIAISAMILPGISGSFILMLLGQYVFVSGLIARMKVDLLGRPADERKKAALELVKDFSTVETMVMIGIFIAGCIVGIILMSRVIHLALKKAHDTTMAFLTGMICSSVYVLWPFKTAKPADVEKMEWLKRAPNIMPQMDNQTYIALGIFIASMIFSATIIYLGKKKSHEIN